MATITIPSPSVFLSTSPVLRPLSPPRSSPKSNQRRQSRGKKATPAASPRRRRATGVVKPKQSKSRDGCVTCKAKRLKCDETKPDCKQCHKRSVPCGRYNKDFKWRMYGEEKSHKTGHPRPRRNTITATEPTEVPLATSPTTSDTSLTHPVVEVAPTVTSTQESNPEVEDVQDYYDFSPGSSHSEPNFSSSVPIYDETSPPMADTYRPRLLSETSPTTGNLSSMFEEFSMDSFPTQESTLTPRLMSLHFGGSEIDREVSDLDLMQDLTTFDGQYDASEDLERVENIVSRPQFASDELWSAQLLARNFPPAGYRNDFCVPVYRQPDMHSTSPEMLMLSFDKQTCGILSIKDGPSENPWRTLIWPLACGSPALYYAIFSMTAFHTSKGRNALRCSGMENMKQSISLLRQDLFDNERPDAALATTLALAFCESWDVHITTGDKHLRGARGLVNKALAMHNKRPLIGDDLARLKFLCNTFIYMDVISRLTSVDADESNDFESLISPVPSSFGSCEIDPLMGCASTLFPLIGRAANLCRRARHSESNSPSIISQALELKEQMEQWESGTSFEKPEDPSSEVKHALQTAEAYRYATLLYLHQAVPENPSLTSAQLANKVLKYLATVPLSSRLVIVQIYPLLAAGCEATKPDDRQWVRDRWQSMSNRMWIGNIDRCCEVMLEVWKRRDRFVAEKEALRLGKQSQRMPHVEISKEMSEAFSFSDMLSGGHWSLAGLKRENRLQGVSGRNNVGFDGKSRMGIQKRRNSESITEEIIEDMDLEYTVRGRLHWIGVMNHWGWEVLLG